MPDWAQHTDEQLAVQSQQGSLDAFEELVRRHEARLFHFLCQKAPSRQDAEDLIQHTFVNAWQRRHLYRSDARFVTWLYTIARNLTVSHYRKHGRVTHCELEAAAPVMVDHRTPAGMLSDIEQREALWRTARQSLKPDAFDVLWMKYREHLSIQEIATLLSRSETSVKVMLHRARKALGAALNSAESVPHPKARTDPSFSSEQHQLTYPKGDLPCSA